ncbi:GGDEF domain-containing protein [Halopseudomonas maritima]|uniref:GGDEF domain-containing protein n=1 Tax=Halopseudomonas maritima TaxID=2918528 RepID=UPI001EEAA947|nr:GGDEF domain-containing protein [Halopseudomonas maritima]UJJ31452.1 GGDEF domain-containing protein [Halopseudomonas maritima]
MRTLWSKLKDDFQLSMITLVGLLAIVGITPYAVYRLGEGSWLVGATDTFLVVSSLLAVLYAWRSGDTIRPGQFLALIYSVGAFLVAAKLGVNGLFWMYVLILFNFFVVPPLQSLVATMSTLIAICAYGWLHPEQVFASRYQMASFVVTCLLCGLFAFVFAFRGRVQRRQLSRLATLDPLTGVGNRRTMDSELDIAIADSRRYDLNFGLLVLDLDHFKQVNDQFGHAAGDQVLVRFVAAVRDVCRPSDRLFRLGGEEFVLLVPKADDASLQTIARHIQQRVREQLRRPDGAPVTVSIGGSLLMGRQNRDNWLKVADENMYEAKRAGRDQTVIRSY